MRRHAVLREFPGESSEIQDGPVTDIQETKELERGKIGELMVKGPMVTQKYVVRSDQNSLQQGFRWQTHLAPHG